MILAARMLQKEAAAHPRIAMREAQAPLAD